MSSPFLPDRDLALRETPNKGTKAYKAPGQRSPEGSNLISARNLIETINSSDTLTQEELCPLFGRASNLVYDSTRLLVLESRYVQLAVIALGAEVASNLDRNKAIYRRSVEFIDGVLKDVPVNSEEREASFLCSCMDLQSYMASGDTESQLFLILRLPLTRMIFEQFLKDWYAKASSYESAASQSLLARLADDPIAMSLHDATCHYIEQDCMLDPGTAYGVIRYIGKRLKALNSIYERVFNAYSRVILKQAKTQAVSEDHSLDCFQNGSFGLLRAISSYDAVSNARFVGHARWWIRQSMLYYLKEDSNLIRVSSNTWQHYAKLEAVRTKHESQLGPLSPEELSKVSGYSLNHVDAIYSTVRTSQVRSLDYPLRTDSSGAPMSSHTEVSSDHEDPMDFQAEDSVKVLLDSLSKELRNIVCLAFGLTEYVVQSLDELDIKVEQQRQRDAALI